MLKIKKATGAGKTNTHQKKRIWSSVQNKFTLNIVVLPLCMFCGNRTEHDAKYYCLANLRSALKSTERVTRVAHKTRSHGQRIDFFTGGGKGSAIESLQKR